MSKGIVIHDWKDTNNSLESKIRRYFEVVLKQKLSNGGVVSSSLTDLQKNLGIYSPSHICNIAGEYGMNAKIEHIDGKCICSFWYNNGR